MVPVENCTGCTACVNICPVQCLEMRADEEGFWYPHLTEAERCIHCGMCERCCPLNDESAMTGLSVEKVYGCHLKEDRQVLSSNSGGAFYGLAKNTILAGGAVYGAVLDRNMHVFHARADRLDELMPQRKSKYAQSDLRDTLKQAKADLDRGIPVLFSGTPCQIAGLKKFLRREYDTLLAVQVFCSEILSPMVWHIYVGELEHIVGSALTEYEYKAKLPRNAYPEGQYDPWRTPQIRFRTAEGKEEIRDRTKDPFINAWANHLISRPSCTACQFKFDGKSKCYADLSIGDFWGCENNAPECFYHLGTSAVITHTEKGDRFFNTLRDELEIKETTVEAILRGNPNICKSIRPNPNRSEFFRELRTGKMDFDTLVRSCLGYDQRLTDLHYKIGIFGSYNTRTVLADICANSGCKMAFHYNNSSFVSIGAPALEMPEDMRLSPNPFRANMLQADFDKRAWDLLENGSRTGAYDCLILDFLEERFELSRIGDSWITISDAAEDTKYSFEKSNLSEEERDELWERSCLRLAEKMSRNDWEKPIILVKMFLNERYGSTAETKEFANIPWIKSINKRLTEYYRFFEEVVPNVHSVAVTDEALCYCDVGHKHGCYPWHANEVYYRTLRQKISAVLTEL